MAIKFKKLQDEINNSPLTEEESNQIFLVEKHVDSIIKKEFKGGEVRIELSEVNFSRDLSPDYPHRSVWGRNNNRPGARQKLMQNELERRYKEAGWKVRTYYDDGRDGPNMSGPDYWILEGDD